MPVRASVGFSLELGFSSFFLYFLDLRTSYRFCVSPVSKCAFSQDPIFFVRCAWPFSRTLLSALLFPPFIVLPAELALDQFALISFLRLSLRCFQPDRNTLKYSCFRMPVPVLIPVHIALRV